MKESKRIVLVPRRFKLVATGALCLLFAGAASADPVWNVYTYANENVGLILESPNGPGANTGGFISYNSNIAANGSPIGGSQDIYPGTGTTSSGPTTPGLTSSTVEVSSSAPQYGSGYNGAIFSAGALATGNLATGSVGVSANGAVYSLNPDTETGASAAAQLMDSLTFDVAGATSTTVTDIGVQFAISGSINPSVPLTPGTAGPSSNMTGTMELGAAQIDYNYDSTAGAPADGRILADGGWVSGTIVSQTPESFIFDGVYALDGSTATLPVLVGLQCATTGGDCSYADTAAISFTLPANVSFTSASGVFLTQPTAVPEPASWPVLIGFLGIAIGVTCKRAPKYRKAPSPETSLGA